MPPSKDPVDKVTGEVVDPGTSLQSLTANARAEVDMQVATAKRYPRDLKACIELARSTALLNEDVAASCCFALERGGKVIEGPSVRLAEIICQAWGNIRFEKRSLAADATFVSGEAVVWDLERNVAGRAETKRRITDRDGRRYNDDMIVTASNAAASVAFRNAVFTVIPRAIVRDIYFEAQDLAKGDIKSLGERRAKAIEWWARYGVSAERICAKFGRASVVELTIEDIAKLKAITEQVKEKHLDIADAFPESGAEPKQGASGLADRVGAKPTAEAPAATPIGETVRDTSEAVEKRRKDAQDLAIKEAKCSPGKKGCSDEGTQVNGKYICSKHDPRNK